MNLDAPRQPLRQHPIQLRCPERIDLQRIDDWLVNALAIAPPAEDSPAPGIPADLPGLLRRCLLINAAYLRHGNVPAFEPGEILRIDPGSDAQTWRVVVGTAHVDQLPAQCFSLALEHALQTALWFNKTERNESTTEQLYRMIEQRIRQPLHQSVPAGKSTIPVLTAAHRRGIPFIHLGAGVYQLGWGSKARKLDRSATDGDSALGCRLAQNKILSAQLLRSACLPAPEHGLARDAGEARQTALRLGWPGSSSRPTATAAKASASTFRTNRHWMRRSPRHTDCPSRARSSSSARCPASATGCSSPSVACSTPSSACPSRSRAMAATPSAS